MKTTVNIIPPAPVKNTLSSVVVELTADEAYWLIGVVGAQTDNLARKLYENLTGEIAAETGESRHSFIHMNPITRDALKMATSNRKGYGEASEPREEKNISFRYHGLDREVVASSISIKGRLLCGVEEKRSGKITNQFKTFYLDDIEGL